MRANWEQIKRDQEGRSGIFHDVPGVLPALLHARKVQRRASAVGFDWHAWDGAWGDLADELRELRAALDAAPAPRAEHAPDPEVVHELGDLLFAATNVARLANVDPELALRAAAEPLPRPGRDRRAPGRRGGGGLGRARPGGAGRLVSAGEGGPQRDLRT